MRHTLLERTAAVIVLIAILCSFWVGWQRVRVERADRAVNIMINETDVRAFANANGKTVPEMLRIFHKHGVSQILFKEVSLLDLAREGKIGLYQGYNVYDCRHPEKLPPLDVNDATTYVVIYDADWQEKIRKEMELKVRNLRIVVGDAAHYDVVAVPTMIAQTPQETVAANQVVEGVGVGYDYDLMKEVAESGLGVVAQIRDWRNPGDESFALLRADLARIPNLKMVMMNDKQVPGYPDQVHAFSYVIRDRRVPLGIVEFSKQHGLDRLGLALDKQVIRVHTISNEEMSRFAGDVPGLRDGEKAALDRWQLAARERNLRALLVRFFEVSEPNYSLKRNLDYLDSLTARLEADGFEVGAPYKVLEMPAVPLAVRAMIGLGVAAGIYLLASALALPLLGLVAAILVALGWLAGLFVAPVLAMKGMALLGVMTFPSLAGLTFLSRGSGGLLASIGRWLGMCAMSFIGAIFTVGILSDTVFMLKLQSFIGVKIAHLVPLLVVLFGLYLWLRPDPMAELRRIAAKTVEYRWALLFGILAVAMVIYVSRTGNTTAELSSSEMGLRQGLTDLLGVRPRSKEFLIGYPLTLVYFYFSRGRDAFWPLVIAAMIGQVSLVNTYAHLHTPLLISLERSANGLWVGLLMGLLFIAVLRGGQWLWGALGHYLERRDLS